MNPTDHIRTVVIARAHEYAGALAGAPLAYQEDGPVLLTRRDGLDPAVGEEIRRLGAGPTLTQPSS